MRNDKCMASNIIRILQSAIDEHGDLPVVLQQINRRLVRRQEFFHILLTSDNESNSPIEIALQDDIQQ